MKTTQGHREDKPSHCVEGLGERLGGLLWYQQDTRDCENTRTPN